MVFRTNAQLVAFGEIQIEGERYGRDVVIEGGQRPEMTMAELADHFDAIQRLAEAGADATLKRFRERADEAGATPQ
jgi:hypothetical protein